MKLMLIQLFIFIFLGGTFAAVSPDQSFPVNWTDLDVIQQIRIIAGVTVMIVFGILSAIIFKSVWVRRGYEGIDKILEGHEVSLFMSHILSFVLVEVFFFMILFYNYVQPPSYAFWICAGGFLSPHVMDSLHFFMNKFKKNNDN